MAQNDHTSANTKSKNDIHKYFFFVPNNKHWTFLKLHKRYNNGTPLYIPLFSHPGNARKYTGTNQ